MRTSRHCQSFALIPGGLPGVSRAVWYLEVQARNEVMLKRLSSAPSDAWLEHRSEFGPKDESVREFSADRNSICRSSVIRL